MKYTKDNIIGLEYGSMKSTWKIIKIEGNSIILQYLNDKGKWIYLGSSISFTLETILNSLNSGSLKIIKGEICDEEIY